MSAVGLARALLTGTKGRAETERRARLMLGCMGEELRQRASGCLAEAGDAPYPAGHLSPWLDAMECLLEAEADLGLRIGAEQALAAAFLRMQDALAGAR